MSKKANNNGIPSQHCFNRLSKMYSFSQKEKDTHKVTEKICTGKKIHSKTDSERGLMSYLMDIDFLVAVINMLEMLKETVAKITKVSGMTMLHQTETPPS